MRYYQDHVDMHDTRHLNVDGIAEPITLDDLPKIEMQAAIDEFEAAKKRLRDAIAECEKCFKDGQMAAVRVLHTSHIEGIRISGMEYLREFGGVQKKLDIRQQNLASIKQIITGKKIAMQG